MNGLGTKHLFPKCSLVIDVFQLSSVCSFAVQPSCWNYICSAFTSSCYDGSLSHGVLTEYLPYAHKLNYLLPIPHMIFCELHYWFLFGVNCTIKSTSRLFLSHKTHACESLCDMSWKILTAGTEYMILV